MKFLKSGLSLAVIGATTIAFVPGASSAVGVAPQAADDTSVSSRMRAAADGSVRITTETATGKVGFVAARGSSADLLPEVEATSKTSAVAKVDAYFKQFGSAFGVAEGQLKQSDVQQDQYGWTVTYRQQYRGVPVFGATLKANLDTAGDLTAVGGYAAPDLDLSVDPRISAAQAAERAVAVVKAEPPTGEDGKPADTSAVKGVLSDLTVYRLGSTKGQAGEAVLVYVVEVSNGTSIRDKVFVDAATNKPVNRYSLVNDSLSRELYETSPAPSSLVWKEGDPTTSLNVDQKNLVDSAGESYWLFKNTFGRDSYDAKGATMKTVNNDPRISCPNANWNGVTTNYCDGVTSDDVVSHEWGHAYTEYTSGLIYQYQSGALNESYSDVWGETLDLINAREDEGEGDITAKRAVGSCDPTAPPALVVAIVTPASVAGPCRAVAAGFGPAYSTTPTTINVAVATDAANDAGPTTTDGCSAFSNAAAVAGKYAYVDRGVCGFQVKVNNAIAAGATGIVIGNNVAGIPPSPAGTSTIPGFTVTQADGTRIKSVGTVTMTVNAEDTSARPDTNRWLIGEKSTAFGGAIRDMWNPTCYGNPGKVTDAEYNCDPLLTDSGGVHGNSGVPNHAYALLVDGGVFNGQTIAGIGLDKAANIWWRAQTAYLTPISDFKSAADSFEQSCLDLVGQPINKLTTVANATPTAATPVVAADCTQVAATMTAVEMRTDPAQCNFQPLLSKDTPELCGAGYDESVVYSEDFEDGLAGWRPDFELYKDSTYAGGIHAPWEADNAAPGNHPGGTAYGPAPDLGDCSGDGVNDFSSRDGITGPVITMPANGITPRLTFEHYIATEGGFDGANMKIKINNGPFTAIPAAAYVFNKPRALTSAAAGNTNPLAGQPGFTGTDAGKVGGSWGESQVDLTMLSVEAGDTVQLRADIGRDGCGGVDKVVKKTDGTPIAKVGGYYLDNVTISVCKIAADVTARQAPSPSRYGTPSAVTVSFADPATSGPVALAVGSRIIGSAVLADGKAVIPVPATQAAGTTQATVLYGGDAQHAQATKPVVLTILKAATTTSVVRKPASVKRGKAGKVTIKVSSTVVPNGTVVLRKAGKVVGQATLRNGVATLGTSKLGRAGLVTFKATFPGGTNFTASQVTFKVRVTK